MQLVLVTSLTVFWNFNGVQLLLVLYLEVSII